MRAILVALSLSSLVALMLPASAQTKNYFQRPSTVNVQFSLRLPLKSDDPAEQERAMEQGRKRLYEMGAKECETILAILASSCRLVSLSVQSNLLRPKNEDNTVNLTANAQYQIDSRDGGRESSKNRKIASPPRDL